MIFVSRIEPGSQALSAVGFMPAIWCSFVKGAWEARIMPLDHSRMSVREQWLYLSF